LFSWRLPSQIRWSWRSESAYSSWQLFLFRGGYFGIGGLYWLEDWHSCACRRSSCDLARIKELEDQAQAAACTTCIPSWLPQSTITPCAHVCAHTYEVCGFIDLCWFVLCYRDAYWCKWSYTDCCIYVHMDLHSPALDYMISIQNIVYWCMSIYMDLCSNRILV